MTCRTCGGHIVFGTTAGSGFDRKVWTHVDPADWTNNPHPAEPKEDA